MPETSDFNLLYREYRHRFIHYAKTYVEDITTAEDIVMDSFIYYLENKHSLKNDFNIPAYILAVIKNKCLNHLQKQRTHEEATRYLFNRDNWEMDLRIATLEACDPEELFSEEVQSIIEKTLNAMPELSREIFFRSKYEGQSNKEIAEAMDLSVKSIEYHMTKSYKLLRIALKDYLPILFLFKKLNEIYPFLDQL